MVQEAKAGTTSVRNVAAMVVSSYCHRMQTGPGHDTNNLASDGGVVKLYLLIII